MKKCPRCDSISADTETSCGVCGGSLTGVSSERLETLVHKVPEMRQNRKPSTSGLALTILTVSMVVGGAALLVLQNLLGLLGLVLLFAGLVLTLLIVGGPAVGWGGGRGSGSTGGREMRDAQIEEKEKEQKRLTGEED